MATKDKLEIQIRKIIITPDIHRIHHSIFRNECNSNYGTIFVFWDKIFKSYINEGKSPQQEMVLGVPGYNQKKMSNIFWMLITPFMGKKDV